MTISSNRVGFNIFIDDKQGEATLKELTAKARALMNELKTVNTHLADINSQLKAQSFSWTRLADSMNHYQTMLMAGVGMLTGIIFTFKNMITGISELDDAMAD